MLDTDTPRSYADKANTLAGLQAIDHCPERRLELESMAPHLASMVSELVDELDKLYVRINGIEESLKKYTTLDRRVLAIVSEFHRSKMRDVCRIIGDGTTTRKVELSLQRLREQDDVAYQERGRNTGWYAVKNLRQSTASS